MRTAKAIICDYRPCSGAIRTTRDRYIAWNCNFHTKCWRRLCRTWYRNREDWDMDVLREVKFLNEEGGGHA